MKRITGFFLGMLLLCFLELSISYVLQLGVFISASSRNVTTALGMILAGPVAVVLVNVAFGAVCETKGWYEKIDVSAIICLGTVIYTCKSRNEIANRMPCPVVNFERSKAILTYYQNDYKIMRRGKILMKGEVL